MTTIIDGSAGITFPNNSVQDHCKLAWTPEVITAYQAQQTNQRVGA